MQVDDYYPDWVCEGCATKAGGKIPDGHLSTWHMGICPCCGHLRPVTQPRDFRYPKLKVLYEYKQATDALGHRHDARIGDLDGADRPERETEQPSSGAVSKI